MKQIIDTNSQEFKKQDQGNFTDQQYEVLKHKEGNLLVSASAGSGKTSILIEKINRLIVGDGVKLKRLLVVTFTNNASLEIKQRLFKSLSESKNEKLLLELEDLSTSDIMTFDSFCSKVVKEFGYTIGQTNKFSVADEAMSGFLKNQAMDNLFANHNKNLDKRFKNFVDMFFEKRNESSLRKSLNSLYEFLRSKEDKNIYTSLLDNMYLFDNKNKAFEYIGKFVLTLKEYTNQQLQHLIDEADILGEDKIKEKLLIAKNEIFDLNGDFLRDLRYLKNGFDFPVFKSSPKDSAEATQIKNNYKDILQNFKNLVNQIITSDIKNADIDMLSQNLTKTKEQLQYVFEIIDEFDGEYQKLKSQYQVLDFNDIEKFARQILSNKDIATEIQNRYDWIFIDEYQDTSYLQESIVGLITTGDNLFMVGDLKQSIYRFRQAEPQIFLNKYNQYKDFKSTNMDKVIELATNFRSTEAILKFNNFVFDKIYKQEIDDYQYKGNADLVFGGLIKEVATEPTVKIFVLNEEKNEQEEDHFEGIYSVKDSELSFDKKSGIQQQANLLASEIKSMIGKPYYDHKTKEIRQIQFKDIAVLSRKKKGILLEVKDVLNSYGIPVYTKYNENIFDFYDIQVLLNILTAIDNQNNDYAIISTFVNIGNISLEELALIRKDNRDKKFFYQAVQEYLKKNNDTISQKIKKCFDKLAYYRNFSYHNNICELINFIIENEKLDLKFEISQNSNSFEERLLTLLNSIDSIKEYSLNSFLNYINNFNSNQDSEITIKDSENAVNLLNIHKSKGLEYPVVFLIATENQFGTQDIKSKILSDNDWGITMSTYDNETHTTNDNLIKNIFKQKIKDEDRKEEKRLLYVAMTRAKNYLTIIGTKNVDNIKSNNTDFEIRNCNNYLDWILGCFSQTELDKLKLEKSLDFDIDGSKMSMYLIEENSFEHEQEEDKTLPEKLNVDKDMFNEILSQKFKKNNLAKKNSVSQIMQEEDHYNISNFEWNKSDKANDEDFLNIGTVYHKVMEYIDFCDDENDIVAQLDNLKESGKISNDEFALIDIKTIIIATKAINKLIDKADIVLKEQQFLSYFPANRLIKTEEDTKILVQGVADLIIIKNDEIYLIDYKTSRISNEKDFESRYKTQLDIYANAIEKFYHKKVSKKAIYSFYLNKLVIIWLLYLTNF